MSDKISIILVDDQQLVREAWKVMLNGDPRFQVVAQCTNGAEAVIESGKLPVDIIIVNINRPAIEGYWQIEDLLKTVHSGKIIAVSEQDTLRYVRQLMDAGVSGFVTKSSPFEELKMAIVRVDSGDRYVCEAVNKLRTY